MEDKQIVELYFERSENALNETKTKYGRYVRKIAYNILENIEDTMECENSTYLKAWESIPPHRPENLATYLGKIARNLALDIYEKYSAKKRGGKQVAFALDELSNCITSRHCVEDAVDEMVLRDVLNRFLEELSKEARVIFVKRYWYLMSVKDIAKEYKMSESKVKMQLLRTREKLKNRLEEENIWMRRNF